MVTKEQVEAVLEQFIRPGLYMDGGDVDLVEVKENRVFVKLKGACHGCPMATMTLQFGIQKVLKDHLPEVEEVVPV